MIITILLVTALVGFITRIFSGRSIFSWLIGSAVMPVAILLNQLLFSYQGEGALLSLGIAILVGGTYGVLASMVGVLLARPISRSIVGKD